MFTRFVRICYSSGPDKMGWIHGTKGRGIVYEKCGCSEKEGRRGRRILKLRLEENIKRDLAGVGASGG